MHFAFVVVDGCPLAALNLVSFICARNYLPGMLVEEKYDTTASSKYPCYTQLYAL